MTLRVGDRVSVLLDGVVDEVHPNGTVTIDLHEHGEVRFDDGEALVGDRIEVIEPA